MYVIYSMVRRRVRVKRNRNATTSKRNSKGASKRSSKGSTKQSGGWSYYGNNVRYADIDYSNLYAYGLVNSIGYTDDIFDYRFLLNELYYDWYTIEAINEINYQYALWELANPTITYYYPEPYIYWLNGYTEYLVKIDVKNNNTGKPNPSVNKTVEVVNNLIKHIEDSRTTMYTSNIITKANVTTLIDDYIDEHFKTKTVNKLQSIITEMSNRLNAVCVTASDINNKCKLYLSGFTEVSALINTILRNNGEHNDNISESIRKFNNTLEQLKARRATQAPTAIAGGKYY